jgi:hypothetical protein
MSDYEIADQTDLEFEREKWIADLELRKRELALKERDSARARWSNPLALAIFAAAIAALGNAAATLINGHMKRTLEGIRAEETRILEVVKTDDPDKASINLKFLVDTGLISDPSRLSVIQNYLKNRKPGEGPKLGYLTSKLAN